MSALGRLLGLGREKRLFEGSSFIPSPTLGYWNASGYPVSTDSALRHAAFYSCVSLIANSLATTPIDGYRKRDELRVALNPAPSLLENPSGDTLQVEWMFSLLTSLLTRGNGFGFEGDFDPMGYPRLIELVHPDDVNVRRTPDRQLEYRFNGQVVPTDRVFHIKGFTMPGWVAGLSVVAHHAQTIGVGLAASSYGAQFYDGAGHPTAVLETDQILDQHKAQELKQRVMDVLRSGRREPIVLGAGTSWKPIQIPPSESMFLDAQRYSDVDIARLFSVPPEKIGAAVAGGGSVTYGNREANVIEFQTDALLPWAVRVEQALSKLLPRGTFVKFNLDAAIRVDLKTRYEVHQIALQNKPFKEVDEVRKLEDLPPSPELNKPPAPPAPPAPSKPMGPMTPPQEDPNAVPK